VRKAGKVNEKGDGVRKGKRSALKGEEEKMGRDDVSRHTGGK